MQTSGDASETDAEDPAHDPLLKPFLQTFLPEFMEKFYPEVAARLDFSAVQWLDKESFSHPRRRGAYRGPDRASTDERRRAGNRSVTH